MESFAAERAGRMETPSGVATFGHQNGHAVSQVIVNNRLTKLRFPAPDSALVVQDHLHQEPIEAEMALTSNRGRVNGSELQLASDQHSVGAGGQGDEGSRGFEVTQINETLAAGRNL